ncbi:MULTISPECIES: carboxypeptidase-like regulatory domain-containing protein [unclassified Pseudodesulfovibrio]|uniref:carboxypeptidase-like regulatory domain-containing protein n=1 Tax=unclassified Pseudodesulfovibrio TaxID=2661612 RepID=UPI000FEBE411|nr:MULTISPECIES: carboxypeptidase-like regulatory domain-containing protein [unclassified Pseudodesulfovibrio]MCJ2162935.1 carboxypeptidase-like regulatory domain-containing protein [Pseudodesulfovibrio sp. S3-i]RWU06937.1 carboxypeptidase regulatory-like domain-containing protein [Pseudodesulfovibrio sp. S3]
MRKILLFTLCLLLLATSAFARDGRIFGVVTDGDGRPVAGARLECVREISQYRVVTFTTADGNFAFNAVPPGIYFVSATLKGVVLGEQRVEFMLPTGRKADFIVDADLVDSVSQ